MSRFLTPDDYATLVKGLEDRIRMARLEAALAVNRELILLYWSIVRDMVARISAERWGAKVVQRLAKDLSYDFPDITGLSLRTLGYMRAFGEAYPDQEIVQQVVAQLLWASKLRPF